MPAHVRADERPPRCIEAGWARRDYTRRGVVDAGGRGDRRDNVASGPIALLQTTPPPSVSPLLGRRGELEAAPTELVSRISSFRGFLVALLAIRHEYVTESPDRLDVRGAHG